MELLIVVALIALMTTAGSRLVANMAVPTARSTAGAIAGQIEAAQAKAMAMGNYTRLAFGNFQQDGRDVLVVGMFISKTGAAGAAPGDWQLARPPTLYTDMAVEDCSIDGGTGFAASDLPPIPSRARGRDVTFTGGMLISPSGSFRAAPAGTFARSLCIQVANRLRPGEPRAAVSLAAVSGAPRVVFPVN